MVRSYILLFCLFFLALLLPTRVVAAVDLSGSNIATGSSSVAMPITDLQITGTSVDPVPVKLFVSNGTLAMSTTTGLTFDGATSGSTLYFSGSVSNLNAALATLTYTRGSVGTDTLEVSLVPRGEVFFPENNHLYKFISGSITANNAVTAAANQTAYGATGYLATITSATENAFVAARLQGDGWIGGSDAAVENDWKWITGPEAGTSFWSGRSDGSTVGGSYANWSSGEPNDYGSGEDCVQFYISSSKWNDLPCTGSTLSGYVVEFGAPGNLPAVVAKNISINTVAAPTVSTLSPLDNATGVSLSANLVIEFSKVITKGTGNILIKKTTDDSTVETIDVTSGQVTGGSSSTITINPATTFLETTGYYVTIPNTAFKDSLNNFYAGISSKTTWNFTTGDFTTPTISSIGTNSITNTAATITWETDEAASSRVSYGLTTAYGTNTSEVNTSPRVNSHSINLSSLLPCTTYHYSVVSRDAATNTASSSDETFTTTGCPVNSTPTKASSTTITTNIGGSTSLNENNRELTVQTPADFTDDAASVVIQIKAIPKEPVLNSLGRPTSVPNEVGSIVFDVKAIINSTTVLDTFDAPITITYQYTDEDIAGLDESTFWLYHYHNDVWTPLDNCVLNTASNTISCTTTGFSVFGLFGKPYAAGSGTSSVVSTDDGVCRSQPPGAKVPWLYGAVPQDSSSVMLYFTHADQPVDHYALEFGTEPGNYRFGALDIGDKEARTYLVQSLRPNTTYYLRVRGMHGCAGGNWSNEIAVTTKPIASFRSLQFVNSSIETAAPTVKMTETESSETNVGDSSETEEDIATASSTGSVAGYSVQIKVVDTDNKPIGGANVTLHSTPREAVTDQDGIAHFADVEGGQHQVIVAYAGYTGEQAINLSGDTDEIKVHITVQQTAVSLSPLAYAIIAMMAVIILVLIIWLIAARRRNKQS